MFSKEKPSPDLELFIFFDSKTNSYGPPTQAQNKHALMRDLINMFQDPKEKGNMLYTNSEDFSIFKIGEYSKKTGLLQVNNMEHIANVHDLRAVAQQQGIVST